MLSSSKVTHCEVNSRRNTYKMLSKDNVVLHAHKVLAVLRVALAEVG